MFQTCFECGHRGQVLQSHPLLISPLLQTPDLGFSRVDVSEPRLFHSWLFACCCYKPAFWRFGWHPFLGGRLLNPASTLTPPTPRANGARRDHPDLNLAIPLLCCFFEATRSYQIPKNQHKKSMKLKFIEYLV